MESTDQKLDTITAASPLTHLEREHADVLGVICEYDDERTTAWGYAVADGTPRGLDRGEIHLRLVGYNATWRGLGRVLNELRREGLVRRLKTGYVPTDAGRACP